MDKILKLLSQSNCKQSEDSLKTIIAGVLAAPKPRAKSQQSLWQTLFDGDISQCYRGTIKRPTKSLSGYVG